MSTATIANHFTDCFAADVHLGLSKSGQKELPSKYLYDAVGSRLFDAITELPEYGLTRAETRILSRHAPEMTAGLGQRPMIAELGSGSGKKTRYILEAVHRPAAYYPIEISRTALAHCERELSDIESIGIVGLERDYLDGLEEVARLRGPGQQLMVLFLGSTIGNFEEGASVRFLRELRRMLAPGDVLLLGADLLKPVTKLIAAYDDPLGVTAAFNLNLLARINRELGGNFDLSQFAHAARFNQESRSIEMHLQSACEQVVKIGGCNYTFAGGETIWTESCHKFTPSEPARMASASGFRLEAQWVDEEWGFTENLLAVR
jgi:L-histidine N-alpha-methyltransferase